MAVIDGDYVTSPYDNTTMKELLRDGNLYAYELKAVDGYVLHDKIRDWYDLNQDTMEEVFKLGFTTGSTTCAASYDFVANPREFYAVLQSEVPADQIFGGVNNDHEVM